MAKTIQIAEFEIQALVVLAVRPAMEARGVGHTFGPEGDYTAIVTRVTEHGTLVWRVRIADLHGGDDFADATHVGLFGAVEKALATIERR